MNGRRIKTPAGGGRASQSVLPGCGVGDRRAAIAAAASRGAGVCLFIAMARRFRGKGRGISWISTICVALIGSNSGDQQISLAVEVLHL